MRHVSPLVALSSTFMITAFGVLWAVLFLDERVDSGLYLGGGLLLLSCLLVMGFDPRRCIAGACWPEAPAMKRIGRRRPARRPLAHGDA